MSSRALSMLAGIAVIMLVFSYVVAGDQPTVQFAFVSGRNLIPDIDTDRVHVIEGEGWGMKTRLARQGDRFVVANRNNYPASTKAFNALMRACLKVRCDEEITENPERHADLNVNWPSGRAHRVRFLDLDGGELVGLIVSNVIEGKVQGNHVRLTGSDTVYRTDNNININSDPLNYLDKQLIPAAAVDIARVELNHDDHFAIEQDAAGKHSLTDIPANMEPLGKSYFNILMRAPMIAFEDFLPVSEKQSLDFDKTFVVEMRSKIRYLLRIAEEGEKFWVVARAEYFGPPKPVLDRNNASIEQIREVAGYKKAFEGAMAYNRRHSGRVYEVHKRFAFYLTHPLGPLVLLK